MQRRKELARNDALLRDALVAQSKAFVVRFGREPTTQDHVFFCWHSDTPTAMCDEVSSEQQPVPVLAVVLDHVDMVSASSALITLDEPRVKRRRVVPQRRLPKVVISLRFQDGDDSGLGLFEGRDFDQHVDDGLRREPGEGGVVSR